jgi:hypothetical protein
MYFRSQGVITDDQLILGLGIQPEVPGDNTNLEGATEDATQTDHDSGHHTLGLDIYDDNNPGEYGPFF